jgi:hypothetical protein
MRSQLGLRPNIGAGRDMHAITRVARVAAFAGMILGLASNASATAISSVYQNFFDLHATWGKSDGVYVGGPGNAIHGIIISVASQSVSTTKTQNGNASVNFTYPGPPNGSGGEWASFGVSGSAVANPDGYAYGLLTYSVTLAFTNMSGLDLDFVTIHSGFSAFNRGGSHIGAQVDNVASEFARFRSGQGGPAIGDGHQCDTRVPVGPHTFPTAPPAAACGVSSPDFSESEFSLSDCDIGETLTRTFTLTLELEASSVPEPSTLALFAAALVGGFSLRQMSGPARRAIHRVR